MKQQDNDDYEYCPHCEMPLEDTEVCGFCKWSRNNTKENKDKE